MGAATVPGEVREVCTRYICVLCGSEFDSSDYQWGVRAGDGNEGGRPIGNWSCPVCGGVVVEYAPVPATDRSISCAALG